MKDHPPLAPPTAHHLPAADRQFGVYTARVTEIRDPEGLGRVKVLFDGSELWARLSTLMGGSKRGSWFIPDPNDEVLVAFAGGDPQEPFILGGLWNGHDRPPETMDAGGANFLKVLRSRNGVTITLDDHDGEERILIETPGGQKLTLEDGPGSVRLEDSNGNVIALESSGVTLTASGTVNVHASKVLLDAGMIQVNAGMTSFAGVVQCDTLISNSVVASSYTPGAGNLQ